MNQQIHDDDDEISESITLSLKFLSCNMSAAYYVYSNVIDIVTQEIKIIVFGNRSTYVNMFIKNLRRRQLLWSVFWYTYIYLYHIYVYTNSPVRSLLSPV